MDSTFVVNFNKIKTYIDSLQENTTGIYFDSIPDNIPFRNHVMRSIKNRYPPLLYIHEVIEEHFTQILFIIKEDSIKDKRFSGWKSFTKNDLVKLCEKDYPIYLHNFSDKEKFVNEFPKKIDEFIDLFCININDT